MELAERDSIDPLHEHQRRIRDINTDQSLSSEDKTLAVTKLNLQRNEGFLKVSHATSADVKERPVKRQAKHNHHHGQCGSECDRAPDAEREEGEAEMEEEEEEKDFSQVLCETCVKLETDGHCRVDNCKSCLSARDRAKFEHFYKYVRRFKGAFPGRNAKPCPHYQRKCWLLAKCCNRYYPCRRCHDEIEDHTINRHETEFVGCSHCGAERQPADENCTTCGYRFASYYCGHCRFYDNDDTKPVYHCEHCGICRMGKGLGIDQHHCHRCKTCVPIDVADNHPCMDSSVQSACPVCLVYMATSTEQVLFMRCGHAIHASCFEKYTKVKYNCPLCFKALTDMSAWYKALDATLAQEEMPPEYENRLTHIICNDCDLKSVAKFHFKFHKCFKCSGYNTRVLSHFDLSEADARACATYKAEEVAKLEAADRAKDRTVGTSSGVEVQSDADDECEGLSSGSLDDDFDKVSLEGANDGVDAAVVNADSPSSPAVQEPSAKPSVALSPGEAGDRDSGPSFGGEAAAFSPAVQEPSAKPSVALSPGEAGDRDSGPSSGGEAAAFSPAVQEPSAKPSVALSPGEAGDRDSGPSSGGEAAAFLMSDGSPSGASRCQSPCCSRERSPFSLRSSRSPRSSAASSPRPAG